MKRRKQLSWLSVFLVVGLVASGCGKKEATQESTEKSSSSSEIVVKKQKEVLAKAKVEDGFYIIRDNSGNDSVITQEELLVLSLEIENLDKSSASYSGSTIGLLNQETGDILTGGEFETGEESRGFDKNYVKKNEKTTGQLYFAIKEDERYDVAYYQDNEWQSLGVEVNPSDYVETKAVLEDPVKATLAYLNVMGFNEDDLNYETFVYNNREKSKQFHQDLFKNKALKLLFGQYKPDEEAVASIYQRFQAMQKSRAKLEPTLVSNTTRKAIVSIKIEELSYSNIKEIYSKYSTEQGLATHWAGITEGKHEADTLPKFEEIMEKSMLVTRDNPIKIELKKIDDKWEFDLNNEEFIRIFFGGFKEK